MSSLIYQTASLKRIQKRGNKFVADSLHVIMRKLKWRNAWKPMLANMSADATQRFQPFQLSSELVEKVDQPNQPKTVFSQ